MRHKTIYSFQFFVLLTLTTYSQGDRLYTKISFTEYKKYKPIDTLLNNSTLLITTAKNIKGYSRFDRLLLRRLEQNDSTYFLFNTNTYLENDSTIVEVTALFKYISDQEIKNGIWLYCEFYSKKATPFKTGVSGIQFTVDSIPPNFDTSNMPTQEGIYFESNGVLIKVTNSQTREAFNSYQKTGFYFIPNSGRLFIRYNIEAIK